MWPLILFLVALVFRLISSNQSLWLDEGTTVQFAKLNFQQLFLFIRSDFHPPLSYLLVHLWLPFAGHSEMLIRLPNILFGALSIPLLYLLLKKLDFNRTICLVAAFLLAINPLHVYYSQELRMYSLNALLSLVTWITLISWLKEKKRKKSGVLFIIFSFLNLYTFYGAFFNLAAQWVYLLFKGKKFLIQFIKLNIFVGFAFLFWLPTFLQQLAGGQYLTKALQGWSDLSGSFSIKNLGLIFAKFSIGRISFADKYLYILFVGCFILYFIFCVFLSLKNTKNRILHYWFFIPLIIAVLMSLKTPVLGYWRYIFLIPAFLSLLVIGLESLPKKIFWLNIGLLTLIFLAGNIIFWTNPVYQREDWRALGNLVGQKDSLIVVNFTDKFAPLHFYAEAVPFYPTQRQLGKTRPDLDSTFPEAIDHHQRIFLMDYLSDLTDKNRYILKWLKNSGLILYKIHNINGLGFVYEFHPPENTN